MFYLLLFRKSAPPPPPPPLKNAVHIRPVSCVEPTNKNDSAQKENVIVISSENFDIFVYKMLYFSVIKLYRINLNVCTTGRKMKHSNYFHQIITEHVLGLINWELFLLFKYESNFLDP